MDKVAFCTLRSLIMSSEQKERLFTYASEELQTELTKPNDENMELSSPFLPIHEVLSLIHFSWFVPHLRVLTEKEAKLFISCLSTKQVKELKEALMLSQSFPKPTTLARKYLTQELFAIIAPENLLPLCFLPKHRLLPLLDLNTSQLYMLIDLLAMHDLAAEIRQIISTQKLKLIYSILTEEQITYLKTLVDKRELVTFKKIGLSEWNTDLNALQSALTQRGINRLAKAIYPIYTSFTWYISHRLEMEKGLLLSKLCTPTDSSQAADLLQDQILIIIKTFINQS
jgi:hypothetical protein